MTERQTGRWRCSNDGCRWLRSVDQQAQLKVLAMPYVGLCAEVSRQEATEVVDDALWWTTAFAAKLVQLHRAGHRHELRAREAADGHTMRMVVVTAQATAWNA
jgi:dipeptidase